MDSSNESLQKPGGPPQVPADFDAAYVNIAYDWGCGGETPERVQHRLSRGLVGPHSLEGGFCPLCGAWYDYPGWRYYGGNAQYKPHPNQATDESFEKSIQVFGAPVTPPGEPKRWYGRLARWLHIHRERE